MENWRETLESGPLGSDDIEGFRESFLRDRLLTKPDLKMFEAYCEYVTGEGPTPASDGTRDILIAYLVTQFAESTDIMERIRIHYLIEGLESKKLTDKHLNAYDGDKRDDSDTVRSLLEAVARAVPDPAEVFTNTERADTLLDIDG